MKPVPDPVQDEEESDASPAPAEAPPSSRSVPWVIAGLVLALLAAGSWLYVRATGHVNQVALAAQPKGVTVIEAAAATFRPSRRYIGTVEPWVEAKIGPQLVAAFVDTVLVRPGARVKRGEVLATLDCRNASAASKAIAMQARALESTQTALANETARVTSLLEGGFVSPNEVELKRAESASKQAQMLGLEAQMLGTSLQVNDCVLRAPFDGEIADRQVDPGAFVRPGTAIATLVDRTTVRLVADVPEQDFEAVAPGVSVRIHLLATGQDLTGTIARRSPGADRATRTVHAELDLANPGSAIPVGTTAELVLDIGQSAPAVEVPLAAVTLRGSKATTFVVRDGKASKVTVAALGEARGEVFLDPELGVGALVVLEGRAALNDGDPVTSKLLESARVAAHPLKTERAQ